MFANKLSDLDDFLAPSLECIKPLTKPSDLQVVDIQKPRPNLI